MKRILPWTTRFPFDKAGQPLPVIEPTEEALGGQKKHVLVFQVCPPCAMRDAPAGTESCVQDESIAKANDGLVGSYIPKGKKKIVPKDKGASVMASGFLCAEKGFLDLQFIEPQTDGMWTLDQLEQ